MKKMLAVCMAVIFFFALLPSGEARAELPKGKTIAVLVKGTSHFSPREIDTDPGASG